MARRSKLLDFQVDQRDIDRVTKKLAKASGQPLYVRMQRATRTAGDLLARRIKPGTPRKTGLLRRSVRSRHIRRGGRNTTGVYVGPMAPHRHLLIRGHRIVTPGGRDTGRRTTANPFVDRAARGFERKAMLLVQKEWRNALR